MPGPWVNSVLAGVTVLCDGGGGRTGQTGKSTKRGREGASEPGVKAPPPPADIVDLYRLQKFEPAL